MTEWGTVATAGLTQRMALRVLFQTDRHTRIRNPKHRIPIRDILLVGVGQYGFDRPDWFPEHEELDDYDDDWHDWKDVEVRTLKTRLAAGLKADILYTIFRVPDHIQEDLNLEVFGRRQDDEPNDTDKDADRIAIREASIREPVQYDDGEFTIIDIEDDESRRYANRRWSAYQAELDLEKPANQTTVKIMIFLEVQLRLAIRESNSKEKMVRMAALKRISTIRGDYSKAAGDVAQLEKQAEPEQESLDAVIMRTQDIRPDWRNLDIEREMAFHNLYELYAQNHHIDFEGDVTAREPSTLPVPKHSAGTPDVSRQIAADAVMKSDGTGAGILVESNN